MLNLGAAYMKDGKFNLLIFGSPEERHLREALEELYIDKGKVEITRVNHLGRPDDPDNHLERELRESQERYKEAAQHKLDSIRRIVAEEPHLTGRYEYEIKLLERFTADGPVPDETDIPAYMKADYMDARESQKILDGLKLDPTSVLGFIRSGERDGAPVDAVLVVSPQHLAQARPQANARALEVMHHLADDMPVLFVGEVSVGRQAGLRDENIVERAPPMEIRVGRPGKPGGLFANGRPVPIAGQNDHIFHPDMGPVEPITDMDRLERAMNGPKHTLDPDENEALAVKLSRMIKQKIAKPAHLQDDHKKVVPTASVPLIKKDISPNGRHLNKGDREVGG